VPLQHGPVRRRLHASESAWRSLRQIERLEAARRERLSAARTEAEQRIVQLMRLGAIGPASAWLLVMEFFGWRAFRNRRELAALAGLVGTPYNSGEAERDQGIKPRRATDR
jgi:transposase